MRKIAFWLSLLILFTFPFEDMYVSPTYGSLARVVGVLAALFWFLTLVLTRKFRRLGPLHVIATLFVLWNCASFMWTVAPSETTERLQTYVQLLVMLFLLWDLYGEPYQLRAAMQAYVLGAYVSLTSQLINYSRGIEAYEFAHGRYSATHTNPNELGLIFALGIPMAWHLATVDHEIGRSVVLRILNFVFIFLGIIGILLTASRGSLAASLPGFLYILVTFGRLPRFTRVAAALLAPVALFYAIDSIPSRVLDRFLTVGSTDNPDEFSLNGRLDVWAEGINLFTESPWIGIGTNSFTSSVPLEMAPHNSYLSVTVDLGLVGFVLFAAMIGLTLFNALRLPRAQLLVWVAVLSIWLIGAFVHNWEHTKHTWLLFTLVAIASDHASRQREGKLVSAENPPAAAQALPAFARQ